MRIAALLHDARRIVPLAWPVFVGQVAVLAFGTVDTLIASRASPLDLAALAIGSAVYVTVFIALMGMVLAVGPIAGQLFGAGKHLEAGAQLHQAMWLALAASVVGCMLLLFPQPFLNLSQAAPEVAAKVRGYLTALAFALPSTLLFTAFRGFNTAVSRPKIVMLLQLGALALKIPMSALLVFGFSAGGLQLPAQGAPGCGMAMRGDRARTWRASSVPRGGCCATTRFMRGLACTARSAARTAPVCVGCCAWAFRWARRSPSR